MKKRLLPDEKDLHFEQLSPARQQWLIETGARYSWTIPEVQAARKMLYTKLAPILGDPHAFVVDRILTSIDRYLGTSNEIDLLAALASSSL